MAKVTTVKTTKLPVVLCLVIFKKFLEIYAKKKTENFFDLTAVCQTLCFPLIFVQIFSITIIICTKKL